MHIDTRLLDGIVVFVEVIRSKSFTAAAQTTGHSTSYISKEINKLESRLGVRLLHRTTRKINLTAEGQIFYQQCEQLVDDARDAQARLSGHQSEPQGTLKVSCPLSFGLSQVRPVLSEFLSKYPKINLELDLDDRKVDLISEGYDLAIRASSQLEDSSLISRRFMTSKGLTLASPSYLQKHGTPIHPMELTQHQTISYRYLKNPNTWYYEDASGKGFDVDVNSKILTNSPEMELALCLQGQGITRLPRFNLKDEIESGLLVPLFEDFGGAEIGVYLVYPSRKHLSVKVRHFIDFIIEHLGN